MRVPSAGCRVPGVAVSLLLLALAAPTWAQTAADLPVVVVRGEGIVKRAPDRALVRVGAESRAKVPKEAQTTNATAMSAVLQKIAAAGIPADAVRTIVISLTQEFDYVNGRAVPRGYLARNTVEVRVDDLTKLGDVLDAAVASGATTVQGLQFDVQDRVTLERDALTRGVADAMARAEAAAAGAKRTVDRVVRIDETVEGAVVRPMPAFRASFAADAAAAPPPTPVSEGEIEIRAVVTVTAVIK